jgi:hypothetical protein
MSLQDLFAQPEIVVDENNNKNIITIYPIKIKDYEKFSQCSDLLYLSKNHFDESIRKFSLLELLVYSFQSLELTENLKLTYEDFLDKFCKLFSMVTLKNVCFIEKDLTFWVNDGGYINPNNYEKVRMIIMKQNLIHEQRVYKTKLMNEWAMKAIKAKQKNAPNISLEDMVSTVSVGAGKNYCDLQDYTIYQIYSDFYRFRKTINYDTSVQYKCHLDSSIKLEDYAEDLDLFHNPYDDLFVSSDKLSGLNKAIKQ